MDYGNITLFETAWEVCNKVGGIYTVVSSKALQVIDNYGENYWLLGPDFGNNADFEEGTDALIDPVRKVLEAHGLHCRLGHWKIAGRPKVILVDFRNRFDQNQLLYEYWKQYGVDSMSGGWDYAEPVMFATACGEVIETIYQHFIEPVGGPAIAQFHEWMCGAGLLHLKQRCPTIGTVFTTHATMLGRSLCGNGRDLYQMLLSQFDPRREAASLGITAKHSMETVSAREADCFTTVSEITAEEASVVLGRKPDIVTPNGLDLRVIPDYSKDRVKPEANRAKLLACASHLLRRTLPPQTRIVVISGRYEFRNKGVDVFLEALARVRRDLCNSQKYLLAICAVMGGHSGVNEDAISGDPSRKPADGEYWMTSHHVHNPTNDPILTTCRRLELDNNPAKRVSVIFTPAMLDGHDGFLNMPYEDLLSAADLGVFPSWYEPWGYTPEESVAHAVPTVTSDLAGFGLWVRNNSSVEGHDSGVAIVSRRQQRDEDVAAALQKIITSVATCSEEELSALRANARGLATQYDWSEFFPYYIKAYNSALSKVLERGADLRESINDGTARILSGATSLTPLLHTFNVFSRLPKSIRRLRELASNLWWCWHPECWSLFYRIDHDTWESSCHNPLKCLENASEENMTELASDPAYQSLYTETMKAFDEYMARPVNEQGRITADNPVAYFSTEYGLHESLPIYSGGLGVLSGDHLKSASDLNVPLVAIGLFYRYGYFRQHIDADGRQVALYPLNETISLPVELMKTVGGDPLEITLPLPGRKLYAQVWCVHVGTIRLFLLDTNIPKNTQDDRKITDNLYVADRDFRIRQEILLGMGGCIMLKALGIRPSVYHMNEGHSAFLILERIRDLMQVGHLSFAEAGEVVRASCAFTTHTPVDAGNERFSADLIRRYFGDYARNVGLSMAELLDTGHLEGANADAAYEMTVLALRYSFRANGVSRLHGDVSRHMWNSLWRGIPVAEVPIGHITNGVHTASYAGPELSEELTRSLGQGWMERRPGEKVWHKLDAIPDKVLWRIRLYQKTLLLDLIRSSVPGLFRRLGLSREDAKLALSRLSENTLLIGFARRFAPYKRGNLLFADAERLLRILSDERRPVTLLFAGKAHPADNAGIDIMQSIVKYSADKRFLGRVFFLEDYSLAISRLMVQGCDVWLNTPRRPYEASGTSGQKAAVNGVLNLSIADGWWCEGYNGTNGWNIGPVVTRVSPDDKQDDYADVEALYTLLEEQVVPAYYFRNNDNVPERWVRGMKDCMRTLIPVYSSHRMVLDYMEKSYGPTADRYADICGDGFAMARRLSAWRQDMGSRFGSLKTNLLRIDGLEGDTLSSGDTMHVTLSLTPGALKPEEICAQLVVGPYDGTGFIDAPDVVELSYERTTSDGSLVFATDYKATRNGYHSYGVRVVPRSDDLASFLDSHMVIWA